METMSLPTMVLIIQALGLPGVFFIVWYFDAKRFQKEKELREKEIQEREKAIMLVLQQYREDVSEIKRLYESNVRLVDDYSATCIRLEKLYHETMSVVSLNTQSFATLADAIKHNDFCPVLRKEGPNP